MWNPLRVSHPPDQKSFFFFKPAITSLLRLSLGFPPSSFYFFFSFWVGFAPLKNHFFSLESLVHLDKLGRQHKSFFFFTPEISAALSKGGEIFHPPPVEVNREMMRRRFFFFH